MVRSFANRIAGLVLTGALATALPIGAAAQGSSNGSPTQVHYSTTITAVYGSPYPIAGHLDLEISPSGTVRGYYHNAYQKAFVPVVGGRDGNYLWFDIGPTLTDLGLGVAAGGRVHVTATMNSDNSFRGQIVPVASASDTNYPDANDIRTQAPGNGQGSPDQYIFAAKPIDKSSEDYPGTY